MSVPQCGCGQEGINTTPLLRFEQVSYSPFQYQSLCLFNDTVTVQTNNKIYLADGNELTGLCAEGSGRGLNKILSVHFLE
jgi:hypothetical protein